MLLLFLLLVAGISAVGGLWPALAAAVAGFLLVNWYFTPPLYTFTIGEGENILALAVFVAVAALVSAFVALAARRAAEGTRARAEAEALSRLAGSSSVDALLESLRRALGRRRRRHPAPERLRLEPRGRERPGAVGPEDATADGRGRPEPRARADRIRALARTIGRS